MRGREQTGIMLMQTVAEGRQHGKMETSQFFW